MLLRRYRSYQSSFWKDMIIVAFWFSSILSGILYLSTLLNTEIAEDAELLNEFSSMTSENNPQARLVTRE